jgi:metallophosphoesterase superfamily enzyme
MLGDSVALPGEPTGEFACRRILFRHQAAPVAAGHAEISGHFHPKASVATRAGSVSRPCFVADGRRLLMPAFGAYTGGLDVAAPPIGRLFPRGGRVFLLGRERLFSFALPAGRRPALRAPEAPRLATEP